MRGTTAPLFEPVDDADGAAVPVPSTIFAGNEEAEDTKEAPHWLFRVLVMTLTFAAWGIC